MKFLFQTKINDKAVSLALLILRLTVAVFMITHGYPKLQRLLAGGEIQFGDPLGLGAAVSLFLAVFAEFFCSILIGLGLMTRLATIPLIITMAVAAFDVHGADAFGRKELALFYMVSYIVILIAGSGKFSVDNLLFRKK